MNEEERNLPEAYRPLSPWTYFGLGILYSIPVLGLIFLIVHAVSAGNINKRNYARSYFCVYVVVIVIVVICAIAGIRFDDVMKGVGTPA